MLFPVTAMQQVLLVAVSCYDRAVSLYHRAANHPGRRFLIPQSSKLSWSTFLVTTEQQLILVAVSCYQRAPNHPGCRFLCTVSDTPSLGSIWTPNLPVFHESSKRLHKPWNLWRSFSKNDIPTPKLCSGLYRWFRKSMRRLLLKQCHMLPPNSPSSCRMRDHCSIYTAGLQAILFALK